MNKIKLLFVEDDISFAYITKATLELTGHYEVYTASNGKEGLELYKQFQPDVIVADIEMPIMNGFEMVEKIRKDNTFVPILFASAQTAPKNVLDGYKLNVDNFIKKPFLPEELNMHIQAIIKRIHFLKPVPDKNTIAVLGNYTFNVSLRLLKIGSKLQKLTDREAKILWKLYENRGEIVKKDLLLKEFWGINDFFTARSLDVFISTLRKYLSEDPNVVIETLRKERLRLVISIGEE